MSAKEEIIEMIKKMPENTKIDDVMEKLYERIKIESALQQLDEGKGIPHEEARKKFEKWLN